MTQFRSNGKRFDVNGKHAGPGEWLDMIHEVNRIAENLGLGTIFGQADSSGDWWAGGYAEEYADARVIFSPDHSDVRVVAKTGRGAELMRLAAACKGWQLA